ncbi:PREDICTED: uncharacterized protein LOC104277510, partial [Apaloderma vittatum]|uniref:uncharacterized protein LOC104277510 n=1 Tax=Apaloderma vittatum TaxID=57397 RepID=UPI000521AC5E
KLKSQDLTESENGLSTKVNDFGKPENVSNQPRGWGISKGKSPHLQESKSQEEEQGGRGMPGSSKGLWTPVHQNQLPLLFLVIISPFVLHMVYGFDQVMVSYIGNCFCVNHQV